MTSNAFVTTAAALLIQLTRDDYVITTRANGLAVVELGGAHQRFADVYQLAVPPNLLGRATASGPRPQSLHQLFPIHRRVQSPRRPAGQREAGGVPVPVP